MLKPDVSLGKFLTLTAELVLLLLVIQVFRLEEIHGLVKISPVILGGFIVHAWLPRGLRLPFFLFLFFPTTVIVFGAPLGVAMIVLGLLFFAICNAPLPFRVRLIVILLVVALLAALRADRIAGGTQLAGVGTVLLPILASMFMFRMIIYIYDRRHEKTKASIWQRLSYFFLFPNICFPLFPVIDYQTFVRTYYNDEPHAIYQKGIGWIFRGITHLLAYRLVYHHLTPSPSAVDDLGGVVLFTVSSYLVYLRISGQFHLIVGVLCLFGFNLPPTHHLFFIASGFSDFWRRVNIYWKDFLTKIVFYPVFVKMRKLGTNAGIVVATLVVFLVTWLLHSYQWFWLRGTFPLTAVDGLFWGLFALMVVINSLYEANRGRRRSLRKPAWSIRAASIRSVRILLMFSTMCVLWSLWGSESISEWIGVIAAAGNSPVSDFALFLLALIALLLIGVAVQYAASRQWFMPTLLRPGFVRAVALPSSAALLLILLGQPAVYSQLGPRTAELIRSAAEDRLNQRDEALQRRGYYEGLQDAGKLTSDLWMGRNQQPPDWKGTRGSDIVRLTGDIREYELVPSHESVFKRAVWRSNRWGMNDKEYEKEKPEGVYRIALLGSSYEMAGGVEHQDTYEAVAEELLNRHGGKGRYDRYEILNFSVGGYGLIQMLYVLENLASEFEPDAVILTGHVPDRSRTIRNLFLAVRQGLPLHYEFIEGIVRESGARRGMPYAEVARRLQSRSNDIMRWCRQSIVEAARRIDAVPVWMFVPEVSEVEDIVRGNPGLTETIEAIARSAAESGLNVMSLRGAYGGRDVENLMVAPWDLHPNVIGHRLLGEAFYRVLIENDELFGLGLTDSRGIDATAETGN